MCHSDIEMLRDLTKICSARNLVRDITGDHAAITDARQELSTPAEQVDISLVATRLFALLFLVKGIECCATSKVQGEHALAEVMRPHSNLPYSTLL
jgi:hypothetical protein